MQTDKRKVTIHNEIQLAQIEANPPPNVRPIAEPWPESPSREKVGARERAGANGMETKTRRRLHESHPERGERRQRWDGYLRPSRREGAGCGGRGGGGALRRRWRPRRRRRAAPPPPPSPALPYRGGGALAWRRRRGKMGRRQSGVVCAAAAKDWAAAGRVGGGLVS